MKKLMIYFSNNNKAMFDVGQVVIVTSQNASGAMAISDAHCNMNVVNWDNVCFIREVEVKEEVEE